MESKEGLQSPQNKNCNIPSDHFKCQYLNIVLQLQYLDKFTFYSPPLPTPGCTFEGGEVEAWIPVSRVDYPRDPSTQEIAAAVHPHLQVRHRDITILCNRLKSPRRLST